VSRELSRAALAAAAEAVLVGLAICGNDPAYGELVRRRQSQIRGLLRRLCRDPALADDLAQQAFLQAWRQVRTLRSPGAFGGWLRQIALNSWLQHVRARGRKAFEPLSGEPPGHENDRAMHDPMVAERLDLDRALSHLAPDVRLCIVLAYGEHMSHREIAEATDLPLGTVKSHITRGAARVRDLLHAYEPTS
jgi:RNA polymerase sigma factor (sigma-70 family)